jgi:hypothetical protein
MIKLNRPDCPYPKALSDGNYKHATNKEVLRQASFDKCMYCESKISHIDHADVEHIKPKAHGKFPELEFAWENLGYVCTKCNGAKSDKYSATTPYINPYVENPEDHLCVMGGVLFERGGSERGQLTIIDVDLNRPALIEKRLERVDQIVKTVRACFGTQNQSLRRSALNAILQEANPDKEFSLVAKTALSSLLPVLATDSGLS